MCFHTIYVRICVSQLKSKADIKNPRLDPQVFGELCNQAMPWNMLPLDAHCSRCIPPHRSSLYTISAHVATIFSYMHSPPQRYEHTVQWFALKLSLQEMYPNVHFPGGGLAAPPRGHATCHAAACHATTCYRRMRMNVGWCTSLRSFGLVIDRPITPTDPHTCCCPAGRNSQLDHPEDDSFNERLPMRCPKLMRMRHGA